MSVQASVVGFVRDVLGCQCPEEVFREIHIHPHPPAEHPLALELDVGGRLLVWLLRSDGSADLSTALPDLVQRGRQTRDRRGFNRVRLVIPEPGPDQVRPLEAAFTQACAGDPKCHLHLIAPEQLAPLMQAVP